MALSFTLSLMGDFVAAAFFFLIYSEWDCQYLVFLLFLHKEDHTSQTLCNQSGPVTNSGQVTVTQCDRSGQSQCLNLQVFFLFCNDQEALFLRWCCYEIVESSSTGSLSVSMEQNPSLHQFMMDI